jgi:hypothetical protein
VLAHVVEDPGFVGELPGRELRVDPFVVDPDLVATAFTGNEGEALEVELELGQNLGRQTDGAGFVVSNRAVFYLDLHSVRLPPEYCSLTLQYRDRRRQ